MGLTARSILFASITMLVLIPFTASAQQVAYTDLGPGNSFDVNNGWSIDGPLDGSTFKYSHGMEFTALATGKLISIDVALFGDHVSTSNPIDVYLTSSMPTSPSNITGVIESYTLTSLTSSPSNLSTLTSLINPTLTMGNNYYLTVVAVGNASAGWQWNSLGIIGNLIRSQDGGNYAVLRGSTLGAFSVNLSPPAVPEASSFAGIALMSLGSTLVLRRKRSV